MSGMKVRKLHGQAKGLHFAARCGRRHAVNIPEHLDFWSGADTSSEGFKSFCLSSKIRYSSGCH